MPKASVKVIVSGYLHFSILGGTAIGRFSADRFPLFSFQYKNNTFFYDIQIFSIEMHGSADFLSFTIKVKTLFTIV